MEKIEFIDQNGTFQIEQAENTSYLYFPIAGEKGLKGCVTPNLGGDSMLDQETFLLEPESVENLHNNKSTRNFWVRVEDDGVWSVTGSSARQEEVKFTKFQDSSVTRAGFMWHEQHRTSVKPKMEAMVRSFVPVDENVEIMQVQIKNLSSISKRVEPIAAIPIYGRSADNLRDHRNVTSMLHRIRTTKYGIEVKPTMSFDEKGHRENKKIYYVMGFTDSGCAPESFFPTVSSWIGEGGSFSHPRALFRQETGVLEGEEFEGMEAMGGLKFEETELPAGETRTYTILMGVADEEAEIARVAKAYCTRLEVEDIFEKTKRYWNEKVNVRFATGKKERDGFLSWISFQPFLRRIYGCSFLPYHDYGRGGRGWRDLWQDCLSLLLMEPTEVRKMIVANFGGVRIDGTNATIIGEGLGNFIADRNGIARVWMDHAFWPFKTLRFYLDQTGDFAILDEETTYFKDPQILRGTAMDTSWTLDEGNQQKTTEGEIYKGTLLEHLLVENLSAFYEVGEHNIIRLRGADWNDALDMAAENGESVAFTFAYAGNLFEIASLLDEYKQLTEKSEIEVFEELESLLEVDDTVYENILEKKKCLENYGNACRSRISGQKKRIEISKIISDLRRKAEWLKEHLVSQEWITGQQGEGWFNSYYDNSKQPVERYSDTESNVRMMLTGQVFAIMSGVAPKEHVQKITKAADHYLYRQEIGGYRLNTDFHEMKFDMGRMFGFAYGEKENGAVFSHMTVMYAYALYDRGFVKEGHKALKTLLDAAMDFKTSRMYPGIPEYFNANGRGVYPYLTGAASWYLMTMVTKVFGIYGKNGDLMIEPKLSEDEFDQDGKAFIKFVFAGKEFIAEFQNTERKEYGSYAVREVRFNGQPVEAGQDQAARIERAKLDSLPNKVCRITVVLN